jgi:hypothetical protein
MPLAVTCESRMPPARHVATGSASNSGRLAIFGSIPFTTRNRSLPAAGNVKDVRPTVAVVWCKPATRTPPASTRGKGVR